MRTEEFRSQKSGSVFTVSGDHERTFITVSGRAATNAKVQKEIAAVRNRRGVCWEEAVWKARMLARQF